MLRAAAMRSGKERSDLYAEENRTRTPEPWEVAVTFICVPLRTHRWSNLSGDPPIFTLLLAKKLPPPKRTGR